RAGGAQGPPRRAAGAVPVAPGADRRRAVLPAAAGPGHHRGRAGLRVGDQGKPARPPRGRPDRLRRRGGRDGRRDGAGEKGGAVVVRRIRVDAATADYAREVLNFPGLRAVLRVDCAATPPGGAAATETRYFATSLDPARVPAAALLRLVRGHWQGENSPHFVQDRGGGEGRPGCPPPGPGAGVPDPPAAPPAAPR